MPARGRLVARTVARAEGGPWAWRPAWPQVHPSIWLLRLAPTRRSLGLGLGVLAVALGSYMVARETPLFGIDRIEVQGGSPRIAAQVRQALRSLDGKPLVGLDGSGVLRKVDALPTVVRASYDRAFPHTLRVTVVPERPAAVLRRGPDSWLVSARGRVIERLAARSAERLPRIWISVRVPVRTGAQLEAAGTGVAARAAGLAGADATRIASASYSNGVLVFRLRSGLELLLGDGSDVKLKLAVADRALGLLPTGTTFLDVSIPGRPVSGTGPPTVFAPTSSSRG